MKNFDYEKAYFVQALPAFNNLNAKQKEAHALLLPLVADLTQQKNLNIPLTEAMKAIFAPLSCQEIAEISRASYFIGHWKPGFVAPIFENKSGQSWKIANVCDQVLRQRFGTWPQFPHNVLIHEGVFRVTFSNKDCWLWEEFGLATEKNLDIFKNCGLPFGADTLDASAQRLIELCGDLWGDVDAMPSNAQYNAFLLIKKEKAMEALKAKHAKKLADIENDIKNSQIELAAFTWLIHNNIPESFIDNCIYYNHEGQFCFGWRTPLGSKEKEQIKTLLTDFPYDYELK